MSAGQWFNWVVWIGLFLYIGVWAVVVWIMALRDLR